MISDSSVKIEAFVRLIMMVCCLWCECPVRMNIHVQMCTPVFAINLSRQSGTKINMIHQSVCVFTRMCVIWCMCVMLLMSLCLSVTTPHSRLEQDMDHRRSLLRCCCSPSDSSVQLDRRSCSHSAPRLASEGDKYDNYPKYQALLFVPY